MRWYLVILSLFVTLISFGQKDNGEVHYLNYDPFFDSDSVGANPVLPVTSYTQDVGYRLINKEKKWSSGHYFNVFPVADFAGSYRSETVPTSSFYGGVGFGITAHFYKQLYARLILTGNYHYFDGILDPSLSLYRTDFGSNSLSNNSAMGIQPQLRLSYSPYNFLNVQFGIDHNFVGQGKRSVLLSDYGVPYPFVQLKTKVWRIEIMNLYQFFKEERGTETIPKYASTHLFNFNFTKRFQVGLFESVIFSPRDTLTYRGYEMAYLNPFLFYRPTEYALGSQDRLLVGLNLSYEFDKVMFYGQWVFDEFVLQELLKRTRWWANKYAGQIGIKGKATFVNGERLKWLAELNFARPFIYSHINKSTSYSNQGRPLAHPLGANFVEVYGEAGLDFKENWGVTARLFFVQQGGFDGSEDLSYGKDVNLPYNYRPYEYGFRIGANGQLNRLHFSVEGKYIISKKIALEAYVRPGLEINDASGQFKPHFLMYGGVRTNLWRDRSFEF